MANKQTEKLLKEELKAAGGQLQSLFLPCTAAVRCEILSPSSLALRPLNTPNSQNPEILLNPKP